LMHIKDHFTIKNFQMISILQGFKERKLHDVYFFLFFNPL
jgi:hypothetical protein